MAGSKIKHFIYYEQTTQAFVQLKLTAKTSRHGMMKILKMSHVWQCGKINITNLLQVEWTQLTLKTMDGLQEPATPY